MKSDHLPFDKVFGEILIEIGRIDKLSLDICLKEQDNSNSLIGEILQKNGYIEENDILTVIGRQFDLEIVDLSIADIDTEFTSYIPIGFLKLFKLVPVIRESESFVAINSQFEIQAIDQLCKAINLKNNQIKLAPLNQIISLINYAYDITQSSADTVLDDIDSEDPEHLFSEIEEIGDLLDDTSDSPVVRLVNLMFSQAIRDNASDIHIEPFQNSLKIRQRLDGVLYDMLYPPKHAQSVLVSRIKIMAKLNIAEKRLPQDGRIELKIGDKEIDVRVSILPTAFGERVVLRLLKKSSVLITLAELGLIDNRLNIFEHEIKRPNGIVLVTGPTGAGKTTTLYAALSAINNSDINIITVEDPIEYRIAGIGQMQVNPKIDLTFATGLRSIVRQDPDVILVGEIRDTETASIAIQSALTGHLVFSTLHTNDAAGAITRLKDMGVESFLIASSINCVLAQRLVRKICDSCKEEYLPEKELILKLGINTLDIGDGYFWKGMGCKKCRFTGYRGRTGIFELLIMNEKLKSLILKTSDANQIKEIAVKNGMVTLRRDGINKIFQGITTIDEVLRVSNL